MVVLLVGIYSEGSVWLVWEVRRVLRLLGVGSKTKNWVDCNISPVRGLGTAKNRHSMMSYMMSLGFPASASHRIIPQ